VKDDSFGTGTEPTGHSDVDLLRRARSGDWDAFETLTSRFQRRVYSLALRVLHQHEDAEDVTQQTFLDVLEHLDTFREEASVATWILRIGVNNALKVLRKRRGLPTVPLDRVHGTDQGDNGLPHPDYIAQWRNDPEDLVGRAEVRQLIEAALAELDEKYRMVFVLRDIEGLSTRETALALNITENNAKLRLLRARLQLRERLTRSLGDESTRVVASHAREQPSPP
jgi:RNA polymerase sigma-70 factor, ECF subfamily